MEDLSIIILFLFVLFLLLGSGVWIGLALMGVAWVGMELFTTRPVGDVMLTTVWTSSSSWTLTALPLFIWMGEILFRTRLSEDMFKGLAPWMAGLPGGLVHTNIVGCTVFAAVSGSSAATLTTVGKMSIPELRKRDYPETMIIGTLAGAATLGLMIPPSLTLIVYGVTINESISKLFFAGILPGLVLASMFMAYVALRHYTNRGHRPEGTELASGPRTLLGLVVLGALAYAMFNWGLRFEYALGLFGAISVLTALFTAQIGNDALFARGAVIGLLIGVGLALFFVVTSALSDYSETGTFAIGTLLPLLPLFAIAVPFWAIGAKTANSDFAAKVANSRFLIPVISLIAVVIGSMYLGYATATEAAAFGVIGGLLLAATQGSLNWSTFTESLMGATRTSAMIALILAGAAFLSLAMGFTGLPRGLADMIAQMELSRFELLMVLLVFYIVLGMFLDGISSVVLTMAVVEPMVREAGIDLIWFGIFIVVVVEMAQITPPIGFNLFVLQGMTHHEMGFIARAGFPMFLSMVLMVFVLIGFPELATWLPDNIRKGPGG